MTTLLGIDLGTSAIKLLMRKSDGSVRKARCAYDEISEAGWLRALASAASKMDMTRVDAIGITSQVGTFIIDDTHVVSWNGPEGLDELHELKNTFPRETFIRNIGMAHPDMVSYPIPRIMHFIKAYPGFKSVCMPKELIIRALTGEYVSDMYSWRGLADLENMRYSDLFTDYLRGLGGDFSLPPLIPHTAMAGRLTREAAALLGAREGVPVYNGCNDFFAALIGAGVRGKGDMFDITGTSEHLGAIAEEMLDTENLISGRYFDGWVRYGVTASSGPSLGYAARIGGGADLSAVERDTAPIFLPYVNGERCPVCDPMARGVMFGVGPECTAADMAYAVMEGVSFNLKQILGSLSMPDKPIIACGGAALDSYLNRLKADILGRTILAVDEPDASALGAAYIAGIGCGEYSCLKDVPPAGVIAEYVPSGDFDYSARYASYLALYPALRQNFRTFGRK